MIMHVQGVACLLGLAQVAFAAPGFRPVITTDSTKGVTTTSTVPSSRANRPAVATQTPVAAGDTNRTILDLGIQPALIRLEVKKNPDFSPNVTQAQIVAEAKYVVIEERLRQEKREAEEAEYEVEDFEEFIENGILVKRARPGLATRPPRPIIVTATDLKCRYFPALCLTKTSSPAAATNTQTPAAVAVATTSTTSSSSPTTTTTRAALPTLMTAAQNIQLDSEFLSEIKIGSNGDQLSVVMDTGSADLWMFSTDCVGCSGTHDYYNPSTSASFINTTTPFKLLYGDGSQTSGIVAFDTVNLAGAPIQAQSIDVAHTISSNLQANAMDGILGLGFPNLQSVQNVKGVTTPFTNMISQGLIPAGKFGLQYIKSNHWSYSGGGGAWTFGGVDTSVISGALTTVPLTTAQYWMIKMDAVSVGSAYSYTPTQNVIVDSGTTLILLDAPSAANIHSYLPGGRVYNGHYQIFCNASSDAYKGTRNAYFTLNGVKYGVPAIDLAWYPESATPGYCYSGIQPWGGSFGILGVMFLKNVYAVFDQSNKVMQFANRVDLSALTD